MTCLCQQCCVSTVSLAQQCLTSKAAIAQGQTEAPGEEEGDECVQDKWELAIAQEATAVIDAQPLSLWIVHARQVVDNKPHDHAGNDAPAQDYAKVQLPHLCRLGC